MDQKTTGIIFFLPYWDVKNPTLEDQTGFIISEMFEEDECMKIGDLTSAIQGIIMENP